jgi:Fe-S-cluster containining protein
LTWRGCRTTLARVDIPRGDLKLLRIVDRAVAEAASRGGTHLVCRPGCTPCCFGPFAITALDAWRLRQALAELSDSDPERARAVTERARAAWAAVQHLFPGDQVRGVLGGDDAAEEAFCTAFEREPCPALDPQAGTCDLYDARPASCRTFGPPMRVGGENLPPCSICFTTASPADVEHARATLDVAELEDALIDELTKRGEGGDTIVAAVLAEGPGARRDGGRT